MQEVVLPDDVVEDAETRIVFVIMDGVGGLPDPETGRTELETAETPNLDRLAAKAALGLIQPVGPGITPGSGPGHLALFGYDPVRWNIGRGVLSALGVDFVLREGDVAARLNFATVDDDGRISDRRAGRPSDDENRRLVRMLREAVRPSPGVELFFESEKEHRVVMILRGENLSADLSDTDPQETGVQPLHVRPTSEYAKGTARLVQDILDQARAALRGEPRANAILARGFAAFQRYPSMADRYRLVARCIARYPMYRGVSRLLGMDVLPPPPTDAAVADGLHEEFGKYDFNFLHFKYTDSRGEDRNFAGKVAAIEAVDQLVPRIEAAGADVLVFTGDHSTPSRMGTHSWHPVPAMIVSPWTRPDSGATFGERSCLRGELGVFPAKDLMAYVLAHAGRLGKFGA